MNHYHNRVRGYEGAIPQEQLDKEATHKSEVSDYAAMLKAEAADDITRHKKYREDKAAEEAAHFARINAPKDEQEYL